ATFIAKGVRSARVIGSPAYPWDEDFIRERVISEARRAFNPAGVGRQMAAVRAGGDRRPKLAKITAPTVVMHGADDPLAPPAAAPAGALAAGPTRPPHPPGRPGGGPPGYGPRPPPRPPPTPPHPHRPPRGQAPPRPPPPPLSPPLPERSPSWPTTRRSSS